MRDFKKLRRFGKNFIFIAILLVIFAGVSNRMDAAMVENDSLVQSRNKSLFRIQKEPEDTIDVLVLGDSLSYSAICPMELWNRQGITSYACGQSGQNIKEAYHMLETAFHNQSPKLVILETNVMFRGKSGLAGIRETVEALGNYYVPIIRSHDIWKSVLLKKTYASEKDYKGFSLRCDVEPYNPGDYMQETEQKEEIADSVLTYMEKIEALCTDHGAELLLLSTPSPVNYNDSTHNALSEYAKVRSLDFLDLNLELEEVGIDWETDSLDKGDHLNFSGARKISAYLGEYLKSEYELPDHRGDDSYEDWENMAAEYSIRAEENLKMMLQ